LNVRLMWSLLLLVSRRHSSQCPRGQVSPTDKTGGTPKLTLGGFKLTDPTVCTRATLALLATLATLEYQPRVVVVSSMGIGEEHHVMPLALRVSTLLLLVPFLSELRRTPSSRSERS
jgi:hypothetical protein